VSANTRSQIPTIYLTAQALHFMAGGMMSVVFAWIIVHELNESQARVGLAQFFAQLPMLFLVLVGGAAADGRQLPAYIARLQIAGAFIPIALAIVIATGGLSFVTATAVLTVGSFIAAFVMPARDALLSYVVPPSLGLARTAALTFRDVRRHRSAQRSRRVRQPSVQYRYLRCRPCSWWQPRCSPRVPLVNPHAFKDHVPVNYRACCTRRRTAYAWSRGTSGYVRSSSSCDPRPTVQWHVPCGHSALDDVYHGDSVALAGVFVAFLWA
jgi:hypothetical protein